MQRGSQLPCGIEAVPVELDQRVLAVVAARPRAQPKWKQSATVASKCPAQCVENALSVADAGKSSPSRRSRRCVPRHTSDATDANCSPSMAVLTERSRKCHTPSWQMQGRRPADRRPSFDPLRRGYSGTRRSSASACISGVNVRRRTITRPTMSCAYRWATIHCGASAWIC